VSVTLTPKAIVEDALRRIGRLSPYDTAADATDLEIGLQQLDLIIAERAGSGSFPWLVPTSVPVPLDTAGKASYDLAGLAVGSKVQFVTAAMLKPATGDEAPLSILTRLAYDSIENKAERGDPERILVTRSPAPILFVHPVPAITTLTVKLTIQTFAASFSDDKGKVAHGWPEAFQRWMGIELACDLGDGPIRQLSEGKLGRMQKRAADAWRALVPYATRQNARGRRCRGVTYRDF
jgi:hypothetical protein